MGLGECEVEVEEGEKKKLEDGRGGRMNEKGKLLLWRRRNSQLCDVRKDKYIFQSLWQGALPPANSRTVLESSGKWLCVDQNRHLKSSH